MEKQDILKPQANPKKVQFKQKINWLKGVFAKTKQDKATAKETFKTEAQPVETKKKTAPQTSNSSVSVKNILNDLFNKLPKKEEKTQTEEAQSQTTTEKPEAEKTGNLFVNLFPKEDSAQAKKEDSLIETIVEQSTENKSILGQKLNYKLQDKVSEEQSSKTIQDDEKELLFWSQITLLLSFLLPLLVFLFLRFQVNPESKMITYLGKENYGMLQLEKQTELENLKSSISSKKTAIAKLKEDLKENAIEKVINTIKAEEVDWLEVLKNIDEVTNKGIAYNEHLKRLVYKSYSFQKQDYRISLSGSLFDPNQSVFFLMTNLIQSINDSEYFTGMEMRSFSKSITEEGAEMSLSLNFNYIPPSARTNTASSVINN